MASLMKLEEAQKKMLDAVHPTTKIGDLSCHEALGRTLGETITCPIDLPPFRSSAMDGYAFRHSGSTYRKVGTSAAGHPFEDALNTGECVRIFTGAMLPEEADTVVPQENITRAGDLVHLQENLIAGANVRPRGMDLQAGQTLLKAGQTLTPACLGLLASAGIKKIKCTQLIKVALLTTGDELIPGDAPLPPGCIYENNLAMLAALINPSICQVTETIHLPDDKAQISSTLQRLSLKADAIITSGGISVGDADFILHALTEHGEVDFWRIALKPGMPTAFGRLGNAAFFGLPGNPVSTAVTFTELVAPCLIRMSGARPSQPVRLQARLQGSLAERSSTRTEFQRGYFECDARGNVNVRSSGDQRSNRISSLVEANCYIILKPEDTSGKEGDLVIVQPFNGDI